jgi:hypothetical protein
LGAREVEGFDLELASPPVVFVRPPEAGFLEVPVSCGAGFVFLAAGLDPDVERVAPLVRLAGGLGSAAGFEVLLVRLRVVGWVEASVSFDAVFDLVAAGLDPDVERVPPLVRLAGGLGSAASLEVLLVRLGVVV